MVKRHYITTRKTQLTQDLQTRTKHGCMYEKSAGIAAADRRLASSSAAAKIVRNSSDQDSSGSSGEEDVGIEKIDIR